MQNAPEMGDYVGLLWRRRFFILIITAVVFGAAMLYTLRQTPVFDSSAEVLVEAIEVPEGPPGFTTLNMDSEVRIATSPEVAEIAAELMAADRIEPGSISVSNPKGEFALLFQGSASTAASAQGTAQAYAEAYLLHRDATMQEDLDAIDEAAKKAANQSAAVIVELTKQLQKAADRNDDATAAVLGQQIAAEGQRQSFQEALRNDVELARGQTVGEILIAAYFPGGQTSPNAGQTGVLAIFLGFSLGVGAVFVRDRLDQSVRRRGDVETSAGAPLLAAIPEGEPGRIMVSDDPHGVTAEAYRALRARVLFAASQEPMRTFMVTSYLHGEGKTTTAVNLAITLAESGRRTVLVGADLHRPDLQSYFDVNSHPGLVAVLAGALPVEEAVMPTTIPNLWILASGPHVPNPAELLGTDVLPSLVAELEERVDFVVIDTPPMTGTSDALTLAPHADGIVLVAGARRSTPATIEEAALELRSVGAKVIGVVLTRLSTRSEYVYARYDRDYRDYRDHRSYLDGEPPVQDGHGALPTRSSAPRERSAGDGSGVRNSG